MEYTNTLTIKQREAMADFVFSGFRDFFRESQHGRKMTEAEESKARE